MGMGMGQNYISQKKESICFLKLVSLRTNETVQAIFTSKRIAENDQRTCMSVESNQPHIFPPVSTSIDRISEVDALNAQENELTS